jgi:hypothetical protein
MNDNDLIDELRDSMQAHTDRAEVPPGFADEARRTARRRSARRAAAAGTPLIAAAGVAAVLATGGGSAGPSSPETPAPTVAVGGGQIQDTACIVRRVSARLATVESDVVKTVETGGNGNPGTNVTVTSWAYTDPQSGVEYTSSDMASPSGTSIYVQFMVGTPAGNGARWVYTNLDPVQHLYAVSSGAGSTRPTLADDIQRIKKQLNSGRAAVDGGATVDGQPTIKLTMPAQEGGWTSTLYVNPQTYAPVRSFGEAPVNPQDPSADTDTTTEEWLPATSENIANARLGQIPANYTQVSQTELEEANPAGR